MRDLSKIAQETDEEPYFHTKGGGPQGYPFINYKGTDFDFFDIQDDLYTQFKEDYPDKADDDLAFDAYFNDNLKDYLDMIIGEQR